MLNYVKGDIVKDSKYRIICQQVNCKGVMGAGLAKQIRNEYPGIYLDYTDALKYKKAKLGDILVYHEQGINGRICVCLFGQDGYGTDRRYTDYGAFAECLEKLITVLDSYSEEWTVAFPYGIGCGLAGGNWETISKVLEIFSEKVRQPVYVVKR